MGCLLTVTIVFRFSKKKKKKNIVFTKNNKVGKKIFIRKSFFFLSQCYIDFLIYLFWLFKKKKLFRFLNI